MPGEGENEHWSEGSAQVELPHREEPEAAPEVEITPEEILEETPVPDTIPAPAHPEPQPKHVPSPRRVAQE